jgi:hypothetical protein
VESQRHENRWYIKDPDLNPLLAGKAGLTAEQALEWLEEHDPEESPGSDLVK